MSELGFLGLNDFRIAGRMPVNSGHERVDHACGGMRVVNPFKVR